jgi:cytidine deaminase
MANVARVTGVSQIWNRKRLTRTARKNGGKSTVSVKSTQESAMKPCESCRKAWAEPYMDKCELCLLKAAERWMPLWEPSMFKRDQIAPFVPLLRRQ